MSQADNKELEKAILVLETIKKDMAHIYNITSINNIKEIKALELVLEELKRLQEENEDFKLGKRRSVIERFSEIEIHDLINRTLQEDYIEKDKIREIKDRLEREYKEELEENSTRAFILKCQIEILKELLERKIVWKKI